MTSVQEYTYKMHYPVNAGLAQMLKGGVIMDVTNEEQARLAEQAGACAVMALHKVPADIIKDGGVARMADPSIIKRIKRAVSIPVMAKARIGHFAEAQILEALEVDFIDESEVLSCADSSQHIQKHLFKTPFVCGCSSLLDALKRIAEGACMLRTKGRAGTGDVSNAVTNVRMIQSQLEELQHKSRADLTAYADSNNLPFDLIQQTILQKRLPVVTFAAGGIATPADAALMMQLGADGIFVGSGIFKSENPSKMAAAIVRATVNYNAPKILAQVSEELGDAMNQ